MNYPFDADSHNDRVSSNVLYGNLIRLRFRGSDRAVEKGTWDRCLY